MATDVDRNLVAYEDGGYVVICDRKNPNAWIRSDTVAAATDPERDRMSLLY